MASGLNKMRVVSCDTAPDGYRTRRPRSIPGSVLPAHRRISELPEVGRCVPAFRLQLSASDGRDSALRCPAFRFLFPVPSRTAQRAIPTFAESWKRMVGRPLRRAPRDMAKSRCRAEGLSRGGALADRALPTTRRGATDHPSELELDSDVAGIPPPAQQIIFHSRGSTLLKAPLRLP
jgi:hypothetical protein